MRSLRTTAAVFTAAVGFGALGLAAAPLALADSGTNASQAPSASGDWAVTATPASPITTDTDVAITVACPQAGCDDTNGPVSLVVTDPRGTDAACASIPLDVTASNGQLVADKLSLAHPYASTCGGLANAPGYNGTWTATVKDTTGVLNTGTFVVKAAPAAPAAPKADPSGSDYTLTWSPNPEPDTYAYGVAIDGTFSGTSAKCAFGASSCSVTVTVPSGQHALTLAAARHTSPTADDFVTGPASPATTVTVAGAPASPSASAHPTTSAHPTATATPSGSVSLPATIVVPSINSLGLGGDFFQNNNPLGALPSLGTGPKVTASASPTLSAYQQYLLDEGPDGTYKSTLPYGTLSTEQLNKIAEQTPTDSGAIGSLASALGVSPVTAASSICGGILALLAALHLSLWTRRSPVG